MARFGISFEEGTTYFGAYRGYAVYNTQRKKPSIFTITMFPGNELFYANTSLVVDGNGEFTVSLRIPETNITLVKCCVSGACSIPLKLYIWKYRTLKSALKSTIEIVAADTNVERAVRLRLRSACFPEKPVAVLRFPQLSFRSLSKPASSLGLDRSSSVDVSNLPR